MKDKIDSIVFEILEQLKYGNYKKFNEEYLIFIDELIVNFAIYNNVDRLNDFLIELNEAYQCSDVVMLWDLFCYEYKNLV